MLNKNAATKVDRGKLCLSIHITAIIWGVENGKIQHPQSYQLTLNQRQNQYSLHSQKVLLVQKEINNSDFELQKKQTKN